MDYCRVYRGAEDGTPISFVRTKDGGGLVESCEMGSDSCWEHGITHNL